MNGKTEIAAALTGVINGLFVILNATGIFHLSPELIGGINGFMVPLILVFLGNRVSRVEETGKITEQTTARVEAAQPDNSSRQNVTAGGSSAVASASSSGSDGTKTARSVV